MSAIQQALLAYGATVTTDPYFSSVVHLGHFDGTSGTGGPYTNSCSRGNQLNGSTGNPLLSTTQKLFGTTSLYTGGSSLNAKTSTHADYDFGTGDWTVELAFRPNALAATQAIFDMRTNGAIPQFAPEIYINTNGSIVYYTNNVDRITSAASVIAATTWHQIAVSKNSGSTRMFVNGTQVGSTYTDSNTYIQGLITIGSTASALAFAPGYYDELRLTKGVGRYTANYTSATAAFPDS